MRGLILTMTAAGLILCAPIHATELEVVGAWKLNRELTTLPAQPGDRRPEGGRTGAGRPGGGGGGGGIGGAGGGGGRGGGLGGFGGRGGVGGGAAPREEEMRKAEAVRRRMSEIPDRLIITRSENSLTITDDFGRSYTLKADGKKQDRLTGDGEFTSKTRFEGTRLIVEEDFGGPKVTTTYTPVLAGGEILRLEVTLKADGMPGAGRERLAARGGQGGPGGRTGPPEVKRVYDSEAR